MKATEFYMLYITFLIFVKPKEMKDTKRYLLLFIVGLFVIAISIVIGYYSRHVPYCDNDKPMKVERMSDEELANIHQSIVKLLKTDELKKNMRYFAAKPHVASTQRTFDNTAEIHRRFKEYGFTPSFHEYDVLLSFSKIDDPNLVSIIDENGKELFKSRRIEKTFEQEDDIPDALPPFSAYSPKGDVTGELVYANYGSKEDFELLIQNNINLTNKIVITRHGPGDAAQNSAKYGAIACLQYTDPRQSAPVEDRKFPNGRWLSDDGVMRGSSPPIPPKDFVFGDSMTRGYPSKPWAFHPEIKDVEGLLQILLQPIAASDAAVLMSFLGGNDVPDKWKSALNISHKFGPFTNSSLKVRLVVNNELKKSRIRNVCGTMNGRIEPDRYVLLGNHIDSWVNGAVDATSGTSVMMEIARVLGEKYKTGWRPRRTMRLCGWDAEEYGLIGSVEYVEEYFSQLYDKAIAYINIDSAVAGNNSLQSAASPLLHEMMFSVHKEVSDPYRNETVYDRCIIEYNDINYPDTPLIYPLGEGSDYYPFYKMLGLPSVDIGYRETRLNKKYNIYLYYPQYHTLHDTIYWIENYVDKEYKFHLTVAKVGLLYLLKLADTTFLPFTMKRYDDAIKRGIARINNEMKKENISDVDQLLKPLSDASNNFSSAVTNFETFLKDFKRDEEKVNSDLLVRMLNDKMMQMEKGFTYPNGLPGKSQIKHYLMDFSSYGKVDITCPLPAVAGLIERVANGTHLEEFKIQVSITASLIQAVGESLNMDL